MLFLAALSTIMPTVLHSSNVYRGNEAEIHFSEAMALILIILYFIYLYFQLISHRALYEEVYLYSYFINKIIHFFDNNDFSFIISQNWEFQFIIIII